MAENETGDGRQQRAVHPDQDGSGGEQGPRRNRRAQRPGAPGSDPTPHSIPAARRDPLSVGHPLSRADPRTSGERRSADPRSVGDSGGADPVVKAAEDTARAWGDTDDANDERLKHERPPHW